MRAGSRRIDALLRGYERTVASDYMVSIARMIANAQEVRMRWATPRGHAISPLRIAFDGDDAVRATEPLTQAGASLIAPTTETPWRSLSARLAGPADLQLTLCEELGDLPHFPGGG